MRFAILGGLPFWCSNSTEFCGISRGKFVNSFAQWNVSCTVFLSVARTKVGDGNCRPGRVVCQAGACQASLISASKLTGYTFTAATPRGKQTEFCMRNCTSEMICVRWNFSSWVFFVVIGVTRVMGIEAGEVSYEVYIGVQKESDLTAGRRSWLVSIVLLCLDDPLEPKLCSLMMPM